MLPSRSRPLVPHLVPWHRLPSKFLSSSLWSCRHGLANEFSGKDFFGLDRLAAVYNPFVLLVASERRLLFGKAHWAVDSKLQLALWATIFLNMDFLSMRCLIVWSPYIRPSAEGPYLKASKSWLWVLQFLLFHSSKNHLHNWDYRNQFRSSVHLPIFWISKFQAS